MSKKEITEFKSGAIRDTAIGKSRMDLIPLELIPNDIINNLIVDYTKESIETNFILSKIFKDLVKLRLGDISVIDDLVINTFDLVDKPYLDILYDLGTHYGAGAEKYGDNNFMLGQKLSHIIGSYERHLYKFINNWKDEAPHERGMLWNVINIKFVITYYKDNKDVCDILNLYKNGKPNVDFIKGSKNEK